MKYMLTIITVASFLPLPAFGYNYLIKNQTDNQLKVQVGLDKFFYTDYNNPAVIGTINPQDSIHFSLGDKWAIAGLKVKDITNNRDYTKPLCSRSGDQTLLINSDPKEGITVKYPTGTSECI